MKYARPNMGRSAWDPTWGCCNRDPEVKRTRGAIFVAKDRWARHSKTWQHALPLHPRKPALGSWLYGRVIDVNARKVFAGGCKACELANQCAPNFKPLQLRLSMSKFLRHQRRASHRHAVSDLLGDASLKRAADNTLRRAPSRACFESALTARQSGTALARGLPGDSPSAWKRVRLQYCVGEAMLMLDRRHLRHASSWASHTDGKGRRLTVQYTAVTKRGLTIRRGLLGHVDYVKCKRPDSVGTIADAMGEILRNLCTFGWAVPLRSGSGPHPKQSFDAGLYKHLKATHEAGRPTHLRTHSGERESATER